MPVLAPKAQQEIEKARKAGAQLERIYESRTGTVRPSPDFVENVGDTLGFVGNTGNAITTPPHLHFGVYYRGEGAVDPAPYLRCRSGTIRLLADR